MVGLIGQSSAGLDKLEVRVWWCKMDKSVERWANQLAIHSIGIQCISYRHSI